jgi:tetratricopeptide (TPR) repeat protein
MINFYELEKKCKKKRFKSILKIISIFVVFILAIFIALFFYKFNKSDKSKNINKQYIIKNIQKNNKKIDKQQKIKIVKNQDKEKNKTIPVKVIKKEINQVKIPKITYILDLDNVNIKNNDKKEDKNLVKKEMIKHVKKKIKSENSKKVILKTTSLTLDKVLIKIKESYKNGDFDNSIKWCKIGSKIDNKNEDIWIYYALNLYKIGQKEKAIKVLKTYLEYKKSKKIENILKRLK